MSTHGQSSTSPTAELTLVVESESGTPEEYFVQRGLTIGRASSNTIVIDHPDLDRIHARVLLEEDGVFRLACEPQAPRLQILEPEPEEVEKVELSPGLALSMGDITIRCRRQVRGMGGISDDYWADAAGGERFKVETDGFKGALPKKIGPYQIRRYVARGGMGIVLRGVHEETDHLAAVKLPTPDLNKDEQWLKRFEQEVQTLKKLVHPNLVRLQDAGKQGDLHWMAMDWVEGFTVGQWLTKWNESGQKVPLEQIQEFMRQMVEGLMYLHSRNVVHRDLKPSNLLVGQDGGIKVADFGLAKQVGGDQSTFLTRTGTMAGTMHYMAPEQTEGLNVSAATDVYALGVIWHQLLTGKRPGHRLKIKSQRPDCPDSWENILGDCLEEEPAERPDLKTIKQALEAEVFKSAVEKEQALKRKEAEARQRREQEDRQKSEREEQLGRDEEARQRREYIWSFRWQRWWSPKRSVRMVLRVMSVIMGLYFLLAILSELFFGGFGGEDAPAEQNKAPSKAKVQKPYPVLWEFETGGVVRSSPAIGSDGTVYVGSNDKKIYAIKTDSKGLAKSPWPMRGQNPQHTALAPATK